MPEYYNPNGYTVHLTGPDGRVIKLGSQQRINLPAFFDMYRSRGMIRLASESNRLRPLAQEPKKIAPTPKPIQRTIKSQQVRLDPSQQKINVNAQRRSAELPNEQQILRREKMAQRVGPNTLVKQVVGRQMRGDANEALRDLMNSSSFAISNDIGIGILSYNRAKSLRRCVQSIIQHTDLLKTTVFISDDGSTDPETLALLEEYSHHKDLVVLKNSVRLGIAGNTNRLLRCLSRFRYGLLLNDDVEVLKEGWEHFYVEGMRQTGMKHFVHRQKGIYGAQLGEPVNVNGSTLLRTNDKPQGAILAFDTDCVRKVGYFNENYGLYGMEHVDWSARVYEAGLQTPGFFDIAGSTNVLKLHAEESAVENRSALLAKARELHNKRITGYFEASDKTHVPALSVVIPYRELERNASLKTVINNIKASRWPEVEIILVEQDAVSRIVGIDTGTINHQLVENGLKPLFNKSMAFNKGVHVAVHDKILMHDADILVTSEYVPHIMDVLSSRPACHIGQTVLYANQEGTNQVNALGSVPTVPCDRIVGYFEGGSLAASKSAYWSVGGYNEAFYGYGCEDCDFFARLASLEGFENTRSFKFLHLWHPRAENWGDHHDLNRALERTLCTLPMAERIKRLLPQTEKYNT